MFDKIWWYLQFIAKVNRHPHKNELVGSLFEDIEIIREFIRELFRMFHVTIDEHLEFNQMLAFDNSLFNYIENIRRLWICADMLARYSKLSVALSESFRTEDDTELSNEDMELKYFVFKK